METTYANRFKNDKAVNEYLKLYAEDFGYANLLYLIDKNALTAIIERLKQKGLGDRYLDFAVGTGRIIKHLEDYFDESEGIDISPNMVAISSNLSASSRIRCADITQEEVPESGYDLITAFRFFLNAEPELRESIMQSLSRRLLDANAFLVVNNHGRLASVKLFSCLYQEFSFRFLGKPKKQLFLSDAKFEDLFIRHGLCIDSKFGYGILGVKIAKLVGHRVAKIIEMAFAGSYLAQLIGTSRIYVLRLK